jgi:hypothetical protein
VAVVTEDRMLAVAEAIGVLSGCDRGRGRGRGVAETQKFTTVGERKRALLICGSLARPGASQVAAHGIGGASHMHN